MKIIVVFIVLILVASGLYLGYGILSFEPEKPAPLVFQEPTPESLRALGLLPKDSQDAAVLTPEQEDQTQKAVAKISEAIAVYQKNQADAPLRMKSTLETLTGSMSSGRLPAYFLNVKDTLHPDFKFDMLNFDVKQVMEVQASPGSAECNDKTSVLLGNDGNDNLACASATGSGDQVFIGGPGDDVISDSFGNRIVNAGGGNDTITLGPGRSIIVLDESWGHDSLTVDCKGTDVVPTEVPKDFPVPWASRYTNFIVLSPRIGKNAVQWRGNNLTNIQTGDTLNVNQNCFTVIGGE